MLSHIQKRLWATANKRRDSAKSKKGGMCYTPARIAPNEQFTDSDKAGYAYFTTISTFRLIAILKLSAHVFVIDTITLAHLRDTLLSKLLSSQLRLPEAKAIVEASIR